MDRFQKFFVLTKVDEAQRIVYGLVTAEAKDRDGETCHYESTKPEYEKVNAELGKASGGENIMPLREMHQLNAVGAGKSITFDDGRKQIHMAFKVVDDSTWKKVCEKVLLGFSQGGRYLKKWTEGSVNYYTAQPGEVSLVDQPCLPGAFIEYAKADGKVEMFKTPENKLTDEDVERITKALEASLSKGVKYLAGDGHLPYTDESGKPDPKHMGAAWAALHGGYRGNKYEGPNKEKALAHLTSLYHSLGMKTPSEKVAEARELLKAELDGVVDTETTLKKYSDLVSGLVEHTATGATEMNPEQIKKCAAALGISEDDFKKQFVEGDALEKGKKGLAALHAHLQKAMKHHAAMQQHHAKISEMHKAHSEMHGQMAEHMENCMKAHGACMDDGEAEKVLKALGVNAEKKEENNNTGGIKKEEMDAAIAKAVKEALDKKPADPPARLFRVERGEVQKAQEDKSAAELDPMAV